jgi:4-hydroxy-2-oxoheptanedioate aldolase
MFIRLLRDSRCSRWRLRAGGAAAAVLGIALLGRGLGGDTVRASQDSSDIYRIHLNPSVEKLAKGEPIIGFGAGDMTIANCRANARRDVDFVYADMEHGPLNFEALSVCVAAMSDVATAVKRRSPAHSVAMFARFPPSGSDRNGNEWVAKQALDIGLMGVLFNSIDTADDARRTVQVMRYPQRKGSKYPNPPGLRGWAPGLAVWAWGLLSEDEYERHADVWPLNPDGDLLSIVMIESVEGVKNADAIAAVPGIGAIFLANRSDLTRSMGAASRNAPEVEAAVQTVLRACKAHNVACGISTGSLAETESRLKEGWKMIRAVPGGVPARR